MNNLFQENKRPFTILLVLLLLLTIVLYFLFLRPLIANVKNQQVTNTSLASEIEVLDARIQALNEQEIDTTELELKVPLTRDLQALVLSLENIEEVSGTKVGSIRLNYNDGLPNIDIDDDESSDTNVVESEENAEDIEEIPNVIPIEDKPERLKMISLRLDVYAPDFEHVKHFIREIEKLKRLTIISRAEFSLPDQLNDDEEQVDQDEEQELMEFTIDLITFYYGN